MRYVDYGLSVWEREIVESMVPKGAVVDLADLFRMLSESGQLAGLEMQERFYEIGSPRGLRDLESYLRAGDMLRDSPEQLSIARPRDVVAQGESASHRRAIRNHGGLDTMSS